MKRAADGRHSTIHPYDATPDLVEFLGEMNYGAYRELGYDKLLLVEGVTEVKTFQQWLRTLGKDHRIVIMHLDGSTMINGKRAAELDEVLRIAKNNELAILIDSERTAKGDPLRKDRADFVQNCCNLNIPCTVLERRAIENYFPEPAIQRVKGPTYHAPGEYDVPKPGWDKNDNWRIAQEMTDADIMAAADLGAFLKAL